MSNTAQQHIAQPAADTAAHQDSAHAVWAPQYPAGLPAHHGNDSATQHIASLPVMEVPAPSPAQGRQSSPLHDTGSMALLLLSALLILITYRTGYKYMENFLHNMFSVRKRENIFEDHTVGETGMAAALCFNTCVLEGLLAYYAMRTLVPALAPAMTASVLPYVGVLTGCTVAFFVLQLGLYWLLGFTFSDPVNTRLWIAGFRASQSLLGLLLFPVTVVMLVYPATMTTTLTLAAVLYVAARIVFICKGFRIFFNKFSATLYFILYLCTVEIVPVVVLCAGAFWLCENL